ncbi:MAG: DUF1015 domain-containing protein [Chloroflexota bacterium]|nr:MAG: DUF1015 domain-containing protein [Chloroflexota bacterium]
MANIKPFKGIRYNPEKIEDINTVISQPYDRVRYGLQDQYYDLSDYNIVRIIKGKEFEYDNAENNVYTRARDFLNKWLEEGVLVQEEHPALYVYHQTFPLPGGGEVTRKAFITAFELAEFDEGIVLPHERTHAGPKVDRLNLTRATETYFGNIFMLYPDPENKVDALLAKDLNREPDIQAKELHEKDVLHKIWVVTNQDVIDTVVAEMAPKRNLIIADGHHRYETALNYRNEQRQKFPDAPANAGFNYRMTAMVSMSNPGLTVLPTHRLIFGYEQKTSADVLEKIKKYFTVEEVASRPALETKMEASVGKVGRIGLATNDGFFFLTLKDQSIMAELAPNRVDAWRELDVSILHKLLLEHVMDISEEKIDKKEGIKYLREPDMGYDQVREEKTAFLFILNSTRIEQITACTDVGEKMPQKSTDFYPKIVTGFAMLPVNETI